MGTTNIELNEFDKCLSIPNFHWICTDEIQVLLKQDLGHQGLRLTSFTSPNSPTNIIVNLNDSDKTVNNHWCFCFIDTTQKIYYSSYGDPIAI